MITKLILDTDITTDIDDCLALALIVASPELQLEGVTCVYGDVDLRARYTAKLLALCGMTSVPITAGMRLPLMNKRPVYWGGHEGRGFLTPEDDALSYSSEHAVDFIVRMVNEQPGQIHLVAIAPLTNVAMAILRDPKLPLAHLTIMGGVMRGANGLHLPYAEHNIICDADAAHVVFSSGIPTTLIPLDLTTQVRVRRAGMERIRAGGTPFQHAVADQLAVYPHFAANDFTYLHDPLAIAMLIDPSLVEFKPVHIDVETNGQHSLGATLMRADDSSPIRVGVSVDVARFEELFVSRVASISGKQM
ncbi:MAG: nucleoside hydrolase [Chloroflexota bacterium]|nr:nucleoside hydrolase [Chloroflexota bacterium]